MIFEPTPLNGNYIVLPQPFNDERGWFMRTYCGREFEQIGHKADWVQMNHSFTSKKGTVRGMHYQLPPHAEIKLVRCIAGAVFDVVIDIRHGSPTFLQWFGTELSAANKKMMYIPEGFAHGFQTLTDNAELLYHHSAYYQPNGEGGIRPTDPKANIKWPLPITSLSQRDQDHQLLNKDYKGI